MMKGGRNLGAAKEGVSHWWLQRLTAVALVPLSVWFVASLLVVAESPDPFRVADWLSSPASALLLVALIIALFWHAKLGFQVVVEDYVHTKWLKYALLIGNNFFCVLAALACVLAVLKLHMFSIVSGV